MTKGALLRILGPLPLATPVVFADREFIPAYELPATHAYTVTGRDGLCVVLSDGELTETDRKEYYDCEQVWP